MEIWKISNQTSDAQFLGEKFKVELIFADQGDSVSGSTTGVLYGNQLLLAGEFFSDLFSAQNCFKDTSDNFSGGTVSQEY